MVYKTVSVTSNSSSLTIGRKMAFQEANVRRGHLFEEMAAQETSQSGATPVFSMWDALSNPASQRPEEELLRWTNTARAIRQGDFNLQGANSKSSVLAANQLPLQALPSIPYYGILSGLTLEVDAEEIPTVDRERIDRAISSRSGAVSRYLHTRATYYQHGPDVLGNSVAFDRPSTSCSHSEYVRYVDALCDVYMRLVRHWRSVSGSTKSDDIDSFEGFYLLCRAHSTWKNFVASFFVEDRRLCGFVASDSASFRRHIFTSLVSLGFAEEDCEWLDGALFVDVARDEASRGKGNIVSALFDTLLNLSVVVADDDMKGKSIAGARDGKAVAGKSKSVRSDLARALTGADTTTSGAPGVEYRYHPMSILSTLGFNDGTQRCPVLRRRTDANTSGKMRWSWSCPAGTVLMPQVLTAMLSMLEKKLLIGRFTLLPECSFQPVTKPVSAASRRNVEESQSLLPTVVKRRQAHEAAIQSLVEGGFNHALAATRLSSTVWRVNAQLAAKTGGMECLVGFPVEVSEHDQETPEADSEFLITAIRRFAGVGLSEDYVVCYKVTKLVSSSDVDGDSANADL